MEKELTNDNQSLQEKEQKNHPDAARFADWILENRWRKDLFNGGWERTFSHQEPQKATSIQLWEMFFNEVIKPTEVKPEQQEICNDCEGSGWWQQFVKPCETCKGTGRRQQENFYCKEQQSVGYTCPEGQCAACAKMNSLTLVEQESKPEEKPDFEAMAYMEDTGVNVSNFDPFTVPSIKREFFIKGCERIWKEYVIPAREGQRLAVDGGNSLAKKYRELESELKQAKEDNNKLKERLDFQIEANDMLYAENKELKESLERWKTSF